MEKIYRYIREGYNKKHVYETVAKQREEGGLNLINEKERIETIKAQLLLETEHQTPESDNLIYNSGIKQIKIFAKTFQGLKRLTPNQDMKDILDNLEPNIEQIRNYKRRK